jgi:uncharacterized protein (DUF849 family)
MDALRSHAQHPLRPYSPLIVNAALTGLVLGKDRAPHLPMSADEIVEDAARCFDAGATIIHIHTRRSDGSPAWEREQYADVIAGIRERCDGVVVCATTSGRGGIDRRQRADVLELEGVAKPDMASLTLGSLNFHTGASVNDIETIEWLASAMADHAIKPELEVFDLGMAAMARRLEEKGLLHGPHYVNVMLGGVNTAPADARSLTALVDQLPVGALWAAAGIGAYQLPMNAISIFMGGHVRTGLEDNPDWDHATREPATNERLVQRVVEIATLAGRAIATPHETRASLRLEASRVAVPEPGKISH